jgi:ABC-type multidrug transport system permease subunit
VGAFFYRSDINFSQINCFYLLLAVFLATLLGSLIGFLIGSLAPNIQAAGNFAFFVNMPSSFLSGIYVPMRQLLKNDKLGLVTKFIPYSYPVNVANRAFSHYNLDPVKDNLLFDNYRLPIIFSLL